MSYHAVYANSFYFKSFWGDKEEGKHLQIEKKKYHKKIEGVSANSNTVYVAVKGDQKGETLPYLQKMIFSKNTTSSLMSR